MKELTGRQEEFLLFFSTLQGNKKCISDASSQFNVSKPTVFNVAEVLEKNGLIIKSSGGEITFTELGLEYIEPKIKKLKVLQKWLTSDLGLPPIVAEFEARKILVTMQEETVLAMLRNISENNSNTQNIKISNTQNNRFENILDGDYEVPFKVYKTNKIDISMGDKGFLKPAILRSTGGQIEMLLYAHKLQYVSEKRNKLQGKLDRLWYASKNKWYEAEMSADSCYIILEEALIFDDSNRFCELKIRARATVGSLKMPESEAIIVFNLKNLPK